MASQDPDAPAAEAERCLSDVSVSVGNVDVSVSLEPAAADKGDEVSQQASPSQDMQR